ncbi:MAG TPA: autotransporter assembly complex family protein [Gammaproteobacteria bacterium]|nr:autotransporter assembly complex family protein [Gammaproteobacteria bacterium]
MTGWNDLQRITAGAVAALAIGTLSACGYFAKSDDAAAAKETAPRIEIQVEGVDTEVAENIRAHLSLTQELCAAPAWRVTRLFARSNEEIRNAVRALGYYSPKISRNLEQLEDCWKATYEVDLGAPVTVEAVEVGISGEASDDAAFAALLDALPVKTGDVVNHALYEQTKQRINSLANERGYLDGRFTTSELRIDPGRGKAVIKLAYDSGRRYRFGALNVKQDVLRPELVRAFFEYEDGAPYDSNKVVGINRALTDSGYFSQVDVRPQTDQPEGDRIPVDVTLMPRKPHQFTASAGASTDTGPRLRLGYENRRLNRRGHRFNSRIGASLVQNDIITEYRIPLKDPRSEWLSLEAGAQQEDTDTSETTSFKLAARQTKKRPHEWLETRFIEATRENFDVGTQSGVITTLLTPGISWSRAVSEARLRPTWGHRVYLELKGGVDSLVSDTTFARTRLSAGWVKGFSWDGRILLRAEGGALTVDEFDVLPPSQRFFTGGDTSVRGYEYQSLGPKDDAGNVIGGKYLLVGSIEYEHPVVNKWSAAVFADAGNAFSDTDSNEGFKVGIGFGVRWTSPIGPVRLDLAHPVSEAPLFRIHFRLGPDL